VFVLDFAVDDGEPVGGEQRPVAEGLAVEVVLIDAGEALHRLAVADGVFERFVGQAIPLLEEMHPQHALQSDRRTTALSLRVERRDDGDEVLPRDGLLHAGEEFPAAGGFHFIRELGLGETQWVGHAEHPAAVMPGNAWIRIKSASPKGGRLRLADGDGFEIRVGGVAQEVGLTGDDDAGEFEDPPSGLVSPRHRRGVWWRAAVVGPK
jgi:hypothetical protein